MPIPAQKPKVRLSWIVILVTVLIYGAGLFLVMGHLRGVIRDQIVQQDGEVLQAATALAQLSNDNATEGAFQNPAGQLEFLLEASKVRGVVALRLFDRDGKFIGSFPEDIRGGTLGAMAAERNRASQSVSRFEAEGSLAEFLPADESAAPAGVTLPLIHAFVPLTAGESYIGSVEFVLDGSNAATAMGNLERDLNRYGVVIFLVGAWILTPALFFAFRRLERVNRLLAERTEGLVRANHELTMAAKTNALGAITAHLLHDLKNPLFGLQLFMANKPATESSSDWDDARQITRRMHEMINQVAGILKADSAAASYELTCREILELTQKRLETEARDHGVFLQSLCAVDTTLPSKEANLIIFILSNLGHNAVQELERGGVVRMEATAEGEDLIFRVGDNGPGLPEEKVERLFVPSASGKAGGSGLGLAISKQLANHLGAELDLAKNGPEGAEFVLRVRRQPAGKSETVQEMAVS